MNNKEKKLLKTLLVKASIALATSLLAFSVKLGKTLFAPAICAFLAWGVCLLPDETGHVDGLALLLIGIVGVVWLYTNIQHYFMGYEWCETVMFYTEKSYKCKKANATTSNDVAA